MNNKLLIISARWVVPVVPRNTVLQEHSIVCKNAKIIDLLPTEKALSRYPDADHVDRENHALIPGFINAHTHAAMNLFRGIADDLPLMEWLSEHMWPAEERWMSAEFVRDGAELAITEMLLSGTTCFNDMYFFPDTVAKTAQEMGIRAFVGMIVIDFPSAWANSSDEYLDKGVQVHDEVRSLSRVNTTMAPHAPYTVSDEPLVKVRTYADELGIPISMHVHETEQEIEDAISNSGNRPLKRLDNLGLLNPRLIAVHMTQLTDQEIELAAQQGIHVAHCPESNLKLASGQCRVVELLASGTNVCLGTDSAASNNDLDMLGEMRTACFIAKNLTKDARALPAWQALELATINGAKALNVSDDIGSIEVGKFADIVAIDLNHISMQPVYDPVAQIVYSASREQVTDVWVGGTQRVKNKKALDIDVAHILKKATDWSEKIKQP